MYSSEGNNNKHIRIILDFHETTDRERVADVRELMC